MSSSIFTLSVPLGERSYVIEIGGGNLENIAPFLTSRGKVTHAVIITDTNVDRLYGEAVTTCLREAGLRVHRLIVDAGEESKSVESASRLWDGMLDLGADRKSIVVALGGGVVGDLAGFVAATFGRGLTFFQVPTTLLAHVDSSVGGKVGINLRSAKNIVGAFWQPAGVLIDTRTLETLPVREFRSGLAEVVKYGVILDADFFQYLETHLDAIQIRVPDVMNHVVMRCCQLKADVVSQDERELTGLRAVLNYGHTFCHAIETVTGYGTYLHGEAVSIGMVCAATLAFKLGRVSWEFCERQRALLEAFHLPVQLGDENSGALLAAMRHDKKAEHGQLRFVLPDKLGHVELVDQIEERLVRQSLEENRA